MTPDEHLEKVDGDCISNLPNDILSLVLSYLSIRNATKTRLSSRRWRYLSPSSPLNIRFDPMTIFGVVCSMNWKNFFLQRKSKFIMVVNESLHFHSGPKIDTLEVTFGLGIESQVHIDNWVSFALDKKTERLSLDLSFYPEGADGCNFPCHILPYHGKPSHLKHLCLTACALAPSPEYAKRLSSLVTLSLTYVRLGERQLESILSACLNLESLEFTHCSLPNNLCISGPSIPLKSLSVHFCFNFDRLKLNSLQKLVTFMYTGCMRKLVFADVPSLEIVYFGHSASVRDYVLSQLGEDLHKLDLLTLVFTPFDLLVIPKGMTTFRHLKQMELSISITPQYDLRGIMNFLNAFPALQKFQCNYRYDRYCSVETHRQVEFKQEPHFELREVEIFGFFGTSNEMDFVSCLLNCCIALKLLAVHSEGKIIFKPRGPNTSKHLNREAIQELFSQQKRVGTSGVEIIIS
ncbi:hypothetical protein OROHE_018583 [Orobanche hederae]